MRKEVRISGKICKIHGEMNEHNARLQPAPWNKEYFRWRCIECGKRQSKDWQDTNREKFREMGRDYQRKNTRLINDKLKEDRKNNPKKFREYERKKREKGGQRYKDYYIQQRFGITPERYYEMIEEQNNKCYLCGEEEKRKWKNGNIMRLCIDHKHDSTKQIRKLLCHNCNAGLGHFKEDHKLLQKAIDYLKEHESGETGITKVQGSPP